VARSRAIHLADSLAGFVHLAIHKHTNRTILEEDAMIQLLPSRMPDLTTPAVEYMQSRLGMPTRMSQAWGPSCRTQHDFEGQPVQQYLTMLVRLTGGQYLLVRQIVDLDRISRRTPSIVELQEREAQWWINHLELDLVCV
jgi:hypothetical protein